jgi:hypothetical protein
MSIECNRIAQELATTTNGDAWYGHSLQRILNGVTAKQAQARAIPGTHSIWELLYHLDAWVNFTLGAVQGVPIPAWPGMPVELDWPAVSDTSESAWKQAVDSFFSNLLRLVETIKTFTDERLEATVPGRTYNFYRLFLGATQHAIYHGGQIALLTKILPNH